MKSQSSDQPVGSAIEPAPPLRLENFLPHQLNVVSSLVSQVLSRVYGRRYDIGIPEWRVLVTLGQHGALTGKDVGARTHMHKTKVSRAAAQLEQRKFILRRTNRSDLREAFLSLTPTGRTIYEEAAPVALELMRRLSDVISPADRAAFERVLHRLTERAATLLEEFDQGDTARRDVDRGIQTDGEDA